MSDNHIGGRFFHTIVLVGSSLAASCGGRAADGLPDDGDDGAMGSGGASASTGGSASAAGGMYASSGGTSSGGGHSSGGAGADWGMGGADECPPQQWTCSETTGCNPVLPASCVCDSSRPADPADCANDEAYVCLPGLVDDQSVQLSCDCVADATTCLEACPTSYEHASPDCWLDDDAFICGCEATILR